MKYQHLAAPAQAAEFASRLADANINPATGLATDYLNHFNEAIMLLEMLADSTDCVDDFLAWQPMSYRDHFAASCFKARDMAIAAYETADPALRDCLDTLAGTMTAVLKATGAAMKTNMPPEATAALAGQAAFLLRPLVARAGAVINGESEAGMHDAETRQILIDGLMKR